MELNMKILFTLILIIIPFYSSAELFNYGNTDIKK